MQLCVNSLKKPIKHLNNIFYGVPDILEFLVTLGFFQLKCFIVDIFYNMILQTSSDSFFAVIYAMYNSFKELLWQLI